MTQDAPSCSIAERHVRAAPDGQCNERGGDVGRPKSEQAPPPAAAPAWRSGLAGALSGLATVAVLHPLDVVRTRLQVHDGHSGHLPRYSGTWHALSSVARTEGLRGLYAGLYPAMLGSTVSWGLYFFLYNRAKQQLQHVTKKPELGPALHLLAAAEAGTLVCLLTNPVWLIKTRLQLQNQKGALRAAGKPYKGFHDITFTVEQPPPFTLHFLCFIRSSDAAVRVFQEEGFRGLYKGLGPSLILVSHGSIQFKAYEESRKLAVRWRSHGDKSSDSTSRGPLGALDYAALGAISKLVAVLCTYPYQVVRSRLQVCLVSPDPQLIINARQRPGKDGTTRYKSTGQALALIYRYEGIRGFYKGMVPTILRVLPNSSITFAVYETIMKLLSF
eukprot:SM000024S07782  [mRNA]  locus=s24:412842:416416:- [translate_table: standard]